MEKYTALLSTFHHGEVFCGQYESLNTPVSFIILSHFELFCSLLLTPKFCSLAIALSFASWHTTPLSKEQIEKLEKTTEKAIHRIAKQIDELQFSVEAAWQVNEASQSQPIDVQPQIQALEECLKACTVALNDVSKNSGHERDIGVVEAFDRAKQLIGNVGNDLNTDAAAVRVNRVIGRDDTRQMVGRVDGNVALEFMK